MQLRYKKMTNTLVDTDQFLEEALNFVYIGQYVRPDGPDRAGVLKTDCQMYYSQLEVLETKGDVQLQGGARVSVFPGRARDPGDDGFENHQAVRPFGCLRFQTDFCS